VVITVEIDDTTKTGKSLLYLIKDHSKTSSGIQFIETVEDNELLEKMKQSALSGRASKKEVKQTLQRILSKPVM
jgi:hypothetical protein